MRLHGVGFGDERVGDRGQVCIDFDLLALTNALQCAASIAGED